MKLEDAAAYLEALGNPTRLLVYRLLVRAGEAGMAVGKLQERLDIAASTLSHHLKTLVTGGLVTQERESTTLICRANYTVMQPYRLPGERVLRRQHLPARCRALQESMRL